MSSLHSSWRGVGRRHPRTARRLLIALVLSLTAAALPASASAEIVWSKGGEIWAMHDDGSGARLLVPLGAAPGIARLHSPGAAPSGPVLVFTGESEANKVTRTGLCGVFPTAYPCFTFHYGFNAFGTYTWKNGTVERVTSPPAYCFNCTDGAKDPTPRADGSVVSQFEHCQGYLDDLSYACVGSVTATSGESYPGCNTVGGVSPNPANGSQVAYTGCKVSSQSALVVTGPGHAGEHAVGCDDAEQEDPTWSPSGTHLADVEGGTEPGIWIYAATNATCFAGSLRWAVMEPSGTSFENPTFVGADKLVFEAGGELWSVAASCAACAFPAAATKLTTGGNNSDPAWTSDPLIATTVTPTLTPTPGPTPAPTPSGSTGPGSGTSQSDTVAPVPSLSQTNRSQRVSKSRKVAVRVTSSEAATATVSGRVSVPGKDPVLTTRKATVAASKTVTVNLTLTAATMRAIRRAWAKHKAATAIVQVALVDLVGNRATATRTITLRK